MGVGEMGRAGPVARMVLELPVSHVLFVVFGRGFSTRVPLSLARLCLGLRVASALAGEGGPLNRSAAFSLIELRPRISVKGSGAEC